MEVTEDTRLPRGTYLLAHLEQHVLDLDEVSQIERAYDVHVVPNVRKDYTA